MNRVPSTSNRFKSNLSRLVMLCRSLTPSHCISLSLPGHGVNWKEYKVTLFLFLLYSICFSNSSVDSSRRMSTVHPIQVSKHDPNWPEFKKVNRAMGSRLDYKRFLFPEERDKRRPEIKWMANSNCHILLRQENSVTKPFSRIRRWWNGMLDHRSPYNLSSTNSTST